MEVAMTISHRCQLVFLRCLNLPNEEDDDNNDDNGVSHHRSGIHSFHLDSVLPGHEHGNGPDSVCTAEHQESKQAEADLYSPRCYPEPVELPMADWLGSSTDWTSPPCSPLHWDSPPSTAFAWESEVVEFVLKQEVDI